MILKGWGFGVKSKSFKFKPQLVFSFHGHTNFNLLTFISVVSFVSQKAYFGIMSITKAEIVTGVKEISIWWIKQRRKKLENLLSDTMSLNPFLVPFLFEYHNVDTLKNFGDLILASHLINGHNTGFGKLVDEKILPRVFGTTKLNTIYRQSNAPLENSAFNEIDHIVPGSDGNMQLLSLKAGKWTIQLTMAIQLNKSFSDILQFYGATFNKIVVGVFYGKSDGLTDKYDILRGINRGAQHHVKDITKNVSVFAGKDFWQWIGSGDPNTQYYVFEGIISALRSQNIKESNQKLLDTFRNHVIANLKDSLDNEGEAKWYSLLKEING